MQPFEQVVQEHGATVLRVCRAVVGPDAAQDAWSETFLSALQTYPLLPDGSDVRAWLLTIAHRRAVDQARSRARRPLPSGTVPDRPARDPVPGGWQDDLWEALRALPGKQRLAVAYHHVAGLPHADVAAIVGGTPAAARKAASDGIATLRRTYLAPDPTTSGATR